MSADSDTRAGGVNETIRIEGRGVCSMSTERYPAELYDEEEKWHISRGKIRSGPFRFSDLVEAADLQLLKATDFVWHHKWGDWRQVKSVPSLASLAGLSDCEQLDLSKPAVPSPALVQKVDIKPRETLPPTSGGWPFWRVKNAVHFANLLLVGFTISSLFALSALVFGNSHRGIGYISIEFTTLMLLGVLITRKSVKSGCGTFRVCMLLAVAAFLLLVMNLDRLPAALDVWQAKRLLVHARTSDQIRRIAVDHPSIKFLELVLAANDAVQESFTATTRLVKELEPQGITLDTMRMAPTRDKLMENARDLRAAAARAELGLTRYLAILESERSNVDQAGQKIYPKDPLHVLPDFMAALNRREDVLRERMGNTFTAMKTFYSLKSDVAEFLVRNWDVVRSPKERSAFADQTASDKYHKLAALVRAAQASVLELERDNLKINADRRTLWSAHIGGSR
jgi:hypothetical protein